MFGDAIQVIDIFNLVVAVSSLMLSLAALLISNRVAKRSISQPLVIEELYEVYEYMQDRELSPDVEKDIPRLVEEIKLVDRKHLILEQAGFREQLEGLNAARRVFGRLSREVAAAKQAGDLTEEQGSTFLGAAQEVDRRLQELLQEIEPRLRMVLKDPLRDLG